MQIHHTHVKKVQKLGGTIEWEDEHQRAKIFIPSRGLVIFGADGRIAVSQAEAAVALIRRYEQEGNEIRLVPNSINCFNMDVKMNGQWLEGSHPPMLWNSMDMMEYISAREANEPLPKGAAQYIGAVNADAKADFEEDMPPTKDGVPTNGAAAHRKGFAVVDNPFEEGSDAAEQWELEWEESAEQSSEEAADPEDITPNSVVKLKYRAQYAEAGHPSHCGDELADHLNRICIVGKKTNMDLLRAILDENGVKYDKYKTSGRGWEGRFRMTTRNMLAKQVWAAKGLLRLPETIDGGEAIQLSQEWVAGQRLKV